jgi:hypothetical protein
LAKRTVAGSEDDQQTSSSIFGGAKPVDTTKREKEIEEKLKKPEPKYESIFSGSMHACQGG